jgi:hypothetical protein
MAIIERARHRAGASEGNPEGYGLFFNAGAPVNGTTFDEIAEKGALLVDTTNAKLYINTGTKSASTWVVVGTQT